MASLASFKVNKLALLDGGVTVPSGTTATFSGSTQVGSGSKITQILFGIATASVPAITACDVQVTGSIAIPGANLGATVFLTCVNASPGGLMAYATSVCTAGAVSASFYNITHEATAACDFQFRYIVIG